MNLLEACWQGNLSQVERLLQQGEDVNQTDVDGSTPLFLAIKQGYSAIVSKLLQYHADVNAQNKSGERICDMAARSNDLAIINLLLQQKMCFDGKALIYAQQKETLKVILKYLAQRCGLPWIASPEARAELLEWKQLKGIDLIAWSFLFDKKRWLDSAISLGLAKRQPGYSTPLHKAAANNDFSQLNTWLQMGAPITAPDEQGRTCGDLAFQNLHKEMFQYCFSNLSEAEQKKSLPKYLEQIEANPSKGVIEMLKPFITAQTFAHLIEVLLLRSYENKDVDSILFCWENHSQIQERAWNMVVSDVQNIDQTFAVLKKRYATQHLEFDKIKAEILPWYAERHKIGLFEWALAKQNTDILELYLLLEFLPYQKQLLAACVLGNEALFEKAMAAGCEVNDSSAGQSPLQYAVMSGKSPLIIKRLLSAGANMQIPSATPGGSVSDVWEMALNSGKAEIINAFASFIEKCDFQTFSRACVAGATEVVQKFRASQSPDELNACLLAAVKANQEGVVLMLLEQGANPTATDESGTSAVDLALNNNQKEMADLFSPFMANGEKIMSKHAFYQACAVGAVALVQKEATGQPQEILDSALYVACVKKQMPVVSLLLSLGAQGCTYKPHMHHSALYIMCQYGNYDGIKMLLDANRPKTIKPSLFRLVMQRGDEALMRLLLGYISSSKVRRLMEEEQNFVPQKTLSLLENLLEEKESQDE